MIYKGTFLNVVDNSGAKVVQCIKILARSQKSFATLGDLILVVIKRVRSNSRRHSNLKVFKSMICKALIIRVKVHNNTFWGDKYKFIENCVVLLTKNNKFIGTRIFGAVNHFLRKTKFLKVISMSSCLIF